MFARVPGVHANLVEVVGLSIFGFVEQDKIFGNFFALVFYLIQRIRRNNALALGILSDLVGNVEVERPAQHPTHALFGIAHQPPVFPDGGLIGACGVIVGAVALGIGIFHL